MEKETPYAIVATTRNGIGIIPYDSSAAAAPKCQNAGSTFRCCQTDTRKPPKSEYLSNHATNWLSYTVIYLIKFTEKYIKNIENSRPSYKNELYYNYDNDINLENIIKNKKQSEKESHQLKDSKESEVINNFLAYLPIPLISDLKTLEVL